VCAAEEAIDAICNEADPRRRQWSVGTRLAAMSDPATPIVVSGRRPETFETFYRSSWRDAVRWACALTGGVAAGEDVAQIAFARIADRYDRLDNPAGYLRTTIVNLARSDRRSGTRRATRELRVVGDRSAAVDATPYAEGSELLGLVGSLPYDQRAAIVLRYWADWDEASIAAALDCRPATVRSHTKRGLDALRRAVGPTPRNDISTDTETE
jgi:RNA polymerase sigma factor (sigma-70 family)